MVITHLVPLLFRALLCRHPPLWVLIRPALDLQSYHLIVLNTKIKARLLVALASMLYRHAPCHLLRVMMPSIPMR